MKKINIVRTACAAAIVTSLSYVMVFAENTANESENIGTVNIESAPIVDSISVDSKIVDIALANQTYVVLDKIDTFYEIEYNGQTAYINDAFLTLSEDAADELIIEEDVPVPVPVIEASEVVAEAVVETVTEEVEIIDVAEEPVIIEVPEVVAEPVEVIEESSLEGLGLYAVLTDSGVNFRSEPNTDSSVLGTGNKNANYEAVAELSNGWIKVLYNGQTAYVHGDYVTTMTADQLPEESSLRTDLVAFAKQYLGTPYVYGGTSLGSGVDCSGFVYSVFQNFDVNLGRSSRDQILDGYRIDKSELQPGDLVFFSYNGGASVGHSSIYIGDNKIIHAASGSAYSVIITDLSEDYYVANYYGAARVIND